MNDDLISRQAAIDALQKEINKGIPPFDDVMGSIRCGVRLARNIIEDLPSVQPEPKWIPVSERSPEINKPVLVWLYDEYYLSELHSIGGVLYWDFDQFDLCGDEFNDVIAWMPLPKPYKEVKDEYSN